MPDNEFINQVRADFEASPESDPYINYREAEAAIREDYPSWTDAIEHGIGNWDTAAMLSSFGMDDPYSVTGIELEHNSDGWTLSYTDNEGTTEIALGDIDLPEWVWDDLYDLADDFDWDWEVSYDGD